MQLSVKKGGRSPKSRATLAELKQGEQGILERIDLPADVAQRLMELGFLPGTAVTRGRSAPGGDPRVFRVGVGQVQVDIYILGRAPDNNWAGLHTLSIET